MMSLVAVIHIHLRMASVTNKSVFSIITTTLAVVGTCPKLKFKSSSKRHGLTGRGYSSKKQAPDVTALLNSECVTALLPKKKMLYRYYYFEDG